MLVLKYVVIAVVVVAAVPLYDVFTYGTFLVRLLEPSHDPNQSCMVSDVG